MRACRISAVAGFIVLPVFRQPTDTRLAFELSSIRPCEKPIAGAVLSVSPGRLSLPCWPLECLVNEAYRIYVDGTNAFMVQPPAPMPGESWPGPTDKYSIEAKANAPRSMAMMRGPMMQRLLEERFHMRNPS